MANVRLWPTIISPAVTDAASLTALDVSGFSDGVSCNVIGLGNFYYDSGSSAIANDVTVISPSAGPGRWLVSRPTVSGSDNILGRATDGPGPCEEISCTAVGRSLIATATATAARLVLSCPNNVGDTASGTWPISITGNAGTIPNLIGDVTSVGTATTISAHATTFAKMQQVPTVTLLGNSTGGTADIQSVTLGTNLSFSGTTLNAAGGGLSPISALSILANPTGASAVPTAVTLGTNLSFSGTTLNAAGGGLSPISALSILANPTGASAVPTAVTLGTNLSFTGSVLNASGGSGGFAFVTIPNSTQIQMAVNTTYCYVIGGAFNASLLLPAVANENDTVRIYTTNMSSSDQLVINQNPGQTIYCGYQTFVPAVKSNTTIGVTGFLKSTGGGLSFDLVCIVENTTWYLTNISEGPAIPQPSSIFTIV